MKILNKKLMMDIPHHFLLWKNSENRKPKLKHLMLIVFALTIFQHVLFAQNTCSLAISLTPISSATFETYSSQGDDFWFKFTAGTDDVFLYIDQFDGTSVPLSSITLYEGTCQALQFVFQKTITSQDSIYYFADSLVEGNDYFFKLSRASIPPCSDCNFYFRSYLQIVEKINFSESPCEKCLDITNLVTNGEFDDLFTGFTSDYTLVAPLSIAPPSPVPTNYSAQRFTITSNANLTNNPFWTGTGSSTTMGSNFLLADGPINSNSNTPVLWSTIITVIPGGQYTFSFDVLNLARTNIGNIPNPHVVFFINEVQQQFNSIGSSIAIIPQNEQWLNLCGNWTCPEEVNTATLKIKIIPGNDYNGNDLGLDKISFQHFAPPLENPTITILEQHYCPNSTITLHGNAVGGIPGYTYTWHETNPFTGLDKYYYTQDVTVTAIEGNEYELTVVDACGVIMSWAIGLAFNIPTAVVNIIDPIVICPNQPVQLHGSAFGGTPPYTYSWTPTTGVNDPTLLQPTVTCSTNTTFTFQVTDNNGCQASASVLITVVSKPNFHINGFQNNCTETATYTASLIDPSFYYTWSITCPPGANCGSIVGSSSGIGLSTITIAWNTSTTFPNSFGSVQVQCTISNSVCEATEVLDVFKCCKFDGIALNNMSITTATQYNGSNITINGTLEVLADFTIVGPCTITMGPNAKIEISNSSTFTVLGSVDFKMNCEPYYMWDGIYVKNPTDKIIFLGNQAFRPKVSEAINGIVSQNGGQLDIRRTDFINNYNSIQILNYFTGMQYYNGPPNISISGSTFDCTYNNYTLLYPPKQNLAPRTGIYTLNIEGLTLGNDNLAQNQFSFLQRGIWAENSNLEVKNAEFINIPPESIITYSWPPKQAAILAAGRVFNAPEAPESVILPSLVINGGENKHVSFDHCNYGIVTQRQSDIINNIEANHCHYAVHLMDIGYPTKIENCDIHKDMSKFFDLEGTGISVFNTFTTTDEAIEKLKISGNIIQGMQTGIHCIQQNSLLPFKQSETVINNNAISLLS